MVSGDCVDTCKHYLPSSLLLQISLCFRFHAFAERTECVKFPELPRRDGDSTMTWNSRKLKGKPPPGTWNEKETVS